MSEKIKDQFDSRADMASLRNLRAQLESKKNYSDEKGIKEKFRKEIKQVTAKKTGRGSQKLRSNLNSMIKNQRILNIFLKIKSVECLF